MAGVSAARCLFFTVFIIPEVEAARGAEDVSVSGADAAIADDY